jgi:hypothetical protein
MKAKEWPCKIGTIPSLVRICRGYKLALGKRIKVKELQHGKPFEVTITEIQMWQGKPGYFKATRN